MTPALIEPRIEFRNLTKAKLLKSLAGSDATDSVFTEIARLIADYIANPSAIPRWPIETLAAQLIMEARADSIKRPYLSMKPSAIVKRMTKILRASDAKSEMPTNNTVFSPTSLIL